MADNDLTSIQLDIETRDLLRVLAKAEDRSMTAQLRWMVKRDYAILLEMDDLAAVRLVRNKTVPELLPEADIEGLATARRALEAARAMQIDFDNILKPDEKSNNEKEPA